MYRSLLLLPVVVFALIGTTLPAAGQEVGPSHAVGMLPVDDLPGSVRDAAQEAVQGPDGEGKDGPMAKVGWELALLYFQHERSGPAGARSLRTASQARPKGRPVRPAERRLSRQEAQILSPISEDGTSVTVDAIASGQASRLLSDLRALGLEGGAEAGAVVSGLLPISSIEQAAALSSLRGMAPSRASTQVGSVDSEADTAHHAFEMRDRVGVDGSGEKICVLSDSYDQNDNAATSATNDISSGDLPGENNPEGRTTPVDVLDDSESGADEGRAMLQLVHDIAPGAELGFHTGFGGLANFAQGIRDLAGADCTVIVDDVSVPLQPFYQDGPVSLAVNDVVNADAAYFSSAGNEGQNSYEAPFRGSGQPGVLSGTSEAHDFDPDDASTDIRQEIEVGTSATFTIVLQWTDPAALSDESSQGPDTDIDIALIDQEGNVVASNQRDNISQGFPFEAMKFTNDGSIDGDGDGAPDSTFAVVIEKMEGPAPDEVKYIYQGGIQIKEYDTLGPTIYGQPQAEKGRAVAAAPFFNTAKYDSSVDSAAVLESFSSKGGIEIRFDEHGNELSSPESREKPDLTGTDGVSNTFFGDDATGDGTPNFFGTSAAAPNVAAIAGLVREAKPEFTAAEVYDRLEKAAVDVTGRATRGGSTESVPTGVDAWSGHGFVQANAALPPRITSVRPRSGTQFTFTRIYGADFAPESFDNEPAFGDEGSIGFLGFSSTNMLGVGVPDRPSGPVEVTVTVGAATSTAAERFTVLTGGTDTFGPIGANLTPVGAGAADWGDFDGDGDLDLVIAAQEAGFEALTVLYENQGGGSFAPAEANLTDADGGSVDWGDFDGDGDLDLIVTGDDGNIGFTPSATIYENVGGGAFAAVEAKIQGVASGSSQWGDFDGDGDLDLVVTGRDDLAASARIYENKGGGTFGQWIDSGLEKVDNGASRWGDYDNDGDLDLVITGLDGDDSPTATIYENQDGGDFVPVGAGLEGVVGSAQWGDYDDDNDLDLVLTGNDGNIGAATTTIYENKEDGEFEPLGAGLTGVKVNPTGNWGDFDADRDLDLIVTGQNDQGAPSTTIYENKEDGEFVPIDAGLTGVVHGISEWADFSGNGKLDLFIAGQTGDGSGSETVALYENGLVAADSKTVEGDGEVTFEGTGVDIIFSGTSGSGKVSVEKQGDAPSGTDGISESNVSAFRYVITGGGDLSFDSDTEVRLDVGSLSGVEAPEDVLICTRPTEGSGSFSVHSTTYEAEANDLVITTGSFSEFALASDSDDNPLPVELAGFEATTTEEGVRLTWRTASEENNAGYEVQRRASGEEEAEWTEINFVESKAPGGTTNETLNYRFTDEGLPYAADRLEYRLRQVDLDGTATLTDPVEIARAVDELELRRVFPNPVRGQATVHFAVPERQEARLEMYDVLGRQVQAVSKGEVEGRRELQLDVSDLASGTYFLRLRAEGEAETRQVTVVR